MKNKECSAERLSFKSLALKTLTVEAGITGLQE